MSPIMGQPLWLWASFLAIVFILLALDLGLFNKDNHEIGIAESLRMSGFYISIGLAFSIWIYIQLGASHAMDYVTGFLVEKSLSLDNIFVIALIFSALQIPRIYQHRVLFWGILGVVILRGVMIFSGAALVSQFHWILYLFAVFLIFTGVKLFFSGDDGEEDYDVNANPLMIFLRKRLPMTDGLRGQNFLVREKDPASGRIKWFATPLLLALLAVETADVIFAVDSVPAIFTITTESYVIYTSNIFAILGLRALFFALAAIIHKFAYLHYALSLVLVFIGSKVFIADFIIGGKFPAWISLSVTATLLIGGVVISLYMDKKKERLNDG